MKISHLSMQSIFLFMDSNLRLKLSQRCKGCRASERLTTLKVEQMSMSPLEFKIDHAIYKLGIVRSYGREEIPEQIKTINKNGGLKFDVDDYGFELDRQEITKQNDEIIVDGRGYQPVSRHHSSVPKWEEDLEKLKRDRNMRLGSTNPTDQEIVKGLETRIRDLILTIQPYVLQRENQVPPYKHFIKLTTIERKGNTVVESYEYVKYERKLHEAMRYLLNQLVGKREKAKPIKIEKLRIYSGGLIRIPLSLKLHVKHLSITDEAKNVCNAIKPILSRRSFPLKSVEVYEDGPFQNTIINNANCLIMVGESRNLRFGELTQRRIHIVKTVLPKDKISELVRNWVRHQKEAGFCYSFRVVPSQVEEALNLMEQLRNWDNARVETRDELRDTLFPLCIIYPVTETTDLLVYCVQVPGERNFWNITVKVQMNDFAV
uniref:tRNA (uracil-O(2)-)-methyltransferase n=2 Tax=Caenorhabditis tropicalis TaxID=1561998 RepID=A0A1I7TLK0_9PELO